MAKRQKKKTKINSILFSIFVVAILSLSFLNKLEIISFNNIMTSVGLTETEVSDAKVSVHFIDVGQGDCNLIISNGISVLIDAGEAEYSKNVISYLKAQNIEKIDYIIATHPHSDHIGGLIDVINTIDVGKIYMARVSNDLTPTSSTYEKLLETISKNNLKITQPKYKEIIDLNGSQLQLFPPAREYDNLNNYSTVAKLTHGENTFLFTGDAEKKVEKDLISAVIDLNSKVLKVGHHGSNTSSTSEFLEKVNPQICIISCGVDNRYNHPSSKTVIRLNEYTESIFRTDLLGTIVVESDGKTLKYKYKGEEYAID